MWSNWVNLQRKERKEESTCTAPASQPALEKNEEMKRTPKEQENTASFLSIERKRRREEKIKKKEEEKKRKTAWMMYLLSSYHHQRVRTIDWLSEWMNEWFFLIFLSLLTDQGYHDIGVGSSFCSLLFHTSLESFASFSTSNRERERDE